MSIYYLVAGDTIQHTMPDWSIPVFALFGLINLGLAIAVWNWKRIGVYGFWVSAIIVMGINLSIGLSLVQSLPGLVGPLILTLLVRPKWNDFT